MAVRRRAASLVGRRERCPMDCDVRRLPDGCQAGSAGAVGGCGRCPSGKGEQGWCLLVVRRGARSAVGRQDEWQVPSMDTDFA